MLLCKAVVFNNVYPSLESKLRGISTEAYRQRHIDSANSPSTREAGNLGSNTMSNHVGLLSSNSCDGLWW